MKRLLTIALMLSVGSILSYGQEVQKFTTVRENPTGKVISVTGHASLTHNSPQSQLRSTSKDIKIGDFIYVGDVMSADFDTRVDLVFVDLTTLKLEQGAIIEINEFTYDPHGHKNESLITLRQGTFDIIVGKIGQTGKMSVNTPLGMIAGIHGAPRVEILPNGDVKFSTLVGKK